MIKIILKNIALTGFYKLRKKKCMNPLNLNNGLSSNHKFGISIPQIKPFSDDDKFLTVYILYLTLNKLIILFNFLSYLSSIHSTYF